MGYNQGDSYEEKIFEILQKKKVLSPNAKRGGSSNKPDLIFLHQSRPSFIEVKLDLKADYGQKMLKWENGVWSWRVDDSVTQLFTHLKILDYINDKNIIPNRYTIPKEEITQAQKKEDQSQFEDQIEIDINALYQYYTNRNCYYIQIGGYGFYHLEEDILNLGTSQFKCKMLLRLRAKTIHSNPLYNYGFYAVLKPDGKPQKVSPYDLEEKDNRAFPPIQP
jgi:hypothetical protein